MGRRRLGKGQIKHESPLLCIFLFASYCCEWSSKGKPRSKPKPRSKGKSTDGHHFQRSKRLPHTSLWEKRNFLRNERCGSRYSTNVRISVGLWLWNERCGSRYSTNVRRNARISMGI